MSYKKSKYFSITKKRKIKYLFLDKKSQITVVFFHGFMSDMTGAKPTAIQKFCKKQNLSFLKFEYSGHGKSKGRFVDGNISKWTRDAKLLIKAKIRKNSDLIFIGSSMGSWIALNLFRQFKSQIKGFIGIASAPQFLEELMWKKFDKKVKKIILKKNIYYLKLGDYFNFNIPIVLFHGLKDDVVPIKFSKKILKIFKKSKKKLIKIKNGDHSLSRKTDLKKICNELKIIAFDQ